MRKLMIVVGCVLLSILQAQAKDPIQLKVMTFNIRFGELATLEQLAALIEQEQPDLVALQELDWMTERERAPHQHHKDFATELGFRTGMFALFGKTIPYANGYYGIGILSRKPIISVRKVMLPKAANVTENRALLMAEIELGDQDTIVFASTHLDYTTAEARVDQLDVITCELTTGKYPVLIGGDFNTQPHAKELQPMYEHWTACCNSQLATSPARAPKNKIDYLFGYPKQAWRLKSTKIIDTQLSDHLPIVSEIELIN